MFFKTGSIKNLNGADMYSSIEYFELKGFENFRVIQKFLEYNWVIRKRVGEEI